MTAFRLAWLELRRFRGRLPRLVPVVLVLVPLLYGAVYLWSNWDPYGRMSDVPVAVVDEDRPVTTPTGQTIAAGEAFTAKLRADHTVGWRFVSSSRADAGLRSGDYYATVTVPADFSASLASATTSAPRQAALHLTLNDANGFIVGKLAQAAGGTVLQIVNSSVQQVYATGAADQLTQLRAALQQASTGAHRISDALGAGTPPATVQPGAAQLAAGLDQLTARVPAVPQGTVGVVAEPVTLTQSNLHPAGVYGRGLAPFFFSIALWVFGLIAYLVLRPFNARALAARVGAGSVALAGWLPAAVLGIAGGLVLYFVCDVGLGVDSDNLAISLGLIAVAAGCFVAIDHFLRTALGVVGDVLSLALLIFQLVSCGGLYPVQTTPLPFRVIHEIIPMTYLVEGLRVGISGGEGSHALRAFLVLGGYLVAALIATTAVLARRRMWTMATMRPAVEV